MGILSTVSDLNNQIMIPEYIIMEGRHQNRVYRFPCLFSPPGHPRLTNFLFLPPPLGGLFSGYKKAPQLSIAQRLSMATTVTTTVSTLSTENK